MGKIRAVLAVSGIAGGLFVSGCGSSHHPACQTDRQNRGANQGNTQCSSSSTTTSATPIILTAR